MSRLPKSCSGATSPPARGLSEPQTPAPVSHSMVTHEVGCKCFFLLVALSLFWVAMWYLHVNGAFIETAPYPHAPSVFGRGYRWLSPPDS